MNELSRISDVAARYNISTRTLRYYEEVGLLWSERLDNLKQRCYDDKALGRLEQILLLRKLQLPMKDIEAILRSQDLHVAVEAFATKLRAVDEEIASLEAVRSLVAAFLTLLKQKGYTRATGLLLLQEVGADLVQHAEQQPCSSDLGKENQIMPETKPSNLTVRIIELKPMKVAYYRAESASPEPDAFNVIGPWAKSAGLFGLATTRVFGFNNPNPTCGNPVYGYEFWVTIPEGFPVPEPMHVKEFSGGLYGVIPTYLYEIREQWEKLGAWVQHHETYAFGSHQWLEESLRPDVEQGENLQMDLFVPIRVK